MMLPSTVITSILINFVPLATAQLSWPFTSPPPRIPKITEYATAPSLSTPCETEFHPSQPDIAWVELIAGNAILRINLTSGDQTLFPLSNPLGLPSGMEFLPDGNLWFSEVAGNAMIRLNPADGSMTEFPFPFTGVTAIDELPLGLRVTIDVSGNRDRGAWFAAAGSNAIGRIDIDTFQYDLFPIPTLGAVPLVIQPGPGSTMIFSEAVGNKVGMIDVFTHEVTEYEVPTPLSVVVAVTYDEVRGLIWVASLIGNLGWIDVGTREVREISVNGLRKQGKSTLVFPDESLHSGDQDLLEALVSGSIGTSGLLPSSGPLRVGTDGKVYFSQGLLVLGGNRIGQYDPETGLLMEFVLPTGLSGPCDLNNQIPGTMFFAEFTGGHLGRLDY
ncbi:Virginiamycin B lyase [Pseudocercospora fuligena]|uniref:Virginiamycin B lyase n=1 Tax=Pseudocercospora fuligena TaxID=685502 RepID=A0A8H6RDZ6_9PEZI|nr:Virginiamycin B lyase [Pseudocercospora fuligena]